MRVSWSTPYHETVNKPLVRDKPPDLEPEPGLRTRANSAPGLTAWWGGCPVFGEYRKNQAAYALGTLFKSSNRYYKRSPVLMATSIFGFVSAYPFYSLLVEAIDTFIFQRIINHIHLCNYVLINKQYS